MPHITVRTVFGSIQFEYEDEADLSDKLAGIVRDAKAVEDAVRDLLPKAPREPKPGFAQIYRFTPSGRVELVHYPSTSVATCVLTLYAYHPDMALASEVEQVTGIESVVSKVLGQTLNKKYFRRDGDLYGLTSKGLDYMGETVSLSLPEPPSEHDECSEVVA